MDVGVGSNNSRQFIDVMKIFRKLGSTAEAFPGLHAFTGCDYNPSFARMGKIKPTKTMINEQKFIDAFRQLGANPFVLPGVQQTLEQFTCCFYGFKTLKDVDEARFLSFYSIFKPAPGAASPLSKIKSVEPSLFPPCKRVLIEQIKRANLIAAIWKNATFSNPSEGYNPLEHGWCLQDGEFAMHWFDGDQVPPEQEIYYANTHFGAEDGTQDNEEAATDEVDGESDVDDDESDDDDAECSDEEYDDEDGC